MKLYDIDAYSLRGKHFYSNLVDFRAKILSSQKHRILSAEQFSCTLCKNKTGKIVLEWEEGYQLFQCERCGAVSPNIEKENIESVYNSNDYYERIMREVHKQYEYRKEQFGKNRYDYVINRLGLTSSKVKVLDVGCGTGYFLSVLKDNNVSCKGLEVTPHLVKYCQDRGLNVGLNKLSEEPDEEYDVITLFDVLEHLSNPALIMNTVRRKLKKGGHCVVFTPNIDSVGFELMQAKQNTLSPFEHLCFLNDESLVYLSTKANLTITSVETYGLDVMDYLLMKEYDDKFPYTANLHKMMILLQAYLDRLGVSNHFRITFSKEHWNED